MGSMLTEQELACLLTTPCAVGEELAPETNNLLLRQLASLDRDLLAEIVTEKHYQQGEVVCHEGEHGEALYLIYSGRAAIVKGEMSTPTVLGQRGPGEIIGEMSILENRPRSASIVALEGLRLLQISRDGFQKLLASVPAMSTKLMESLSARVREASETAAAEAVAGLQVRQTLSGLQQDHDRLLELERVRQETSDLIVHDLRNPLTTISGALDMLELTLPEDVQQTNSQLLHLARSASDRMQRLINALLDVARLESGQAPFHPAPTDLRALLEQIVTRQSLALENGQIGLFADIPIDLPTIVVDAEMIDRVLSNLIDNAVRYTREGGEIVLAAAVEGEQARISVADAGPGIPPEDRERIFARFAQVDKDKRHGRRGFGLGLTFCRLAVERHGGRIWVEEGEGGMGSRFVFTLPLAGPPPSK